MTGLDGHRVYLDWNATAPLRPEARAAMLAAMDVVGNPSSVHAEGRAAKAIVEKARGQVAALVGCAPEEVVFTSGATEAVKAAAGLTWHAIVLSGFEHEAVFQRLGPHSPNGIASILGTGSFNNCRLTDGSFWVHDSTKRWVEKLQSVDSPRIVLCMTCYDGETGIFVGSGPVLDEVEFHMRCLAGAEQRPLRFCDMSQSLGKPAPQDFRMMKADLACASSAKIGGPKGVGILVLNGGAEIPLSDPGGGQEKGRRSGTENVIGIAGFGAAAEAAQRDLEDGVWDRVAHLRDNLEDAVASAAPDLHIFGKDAPRLPNTSCFAVPGWKGETQVMQMDLAGFAVSAGSACSSGKVNKASRVLLAMGFDEVTASSAIRVSLGPTTSEAEVMAFAETWIDHYRRRRSRAA